MIWEQQKIFQQIWGNSFFGGEGSVSLMFCTYFWSAEVAKVFIPCEFYDKTICLRIGLRQILGQDLGQSIECNVWISLYTYNIYIYIHVRHMIFIYISINFVSSFLRIDPAAVDAVKSSRCSSVEMVSQWATVAGDWALVSWAMSKTTFERKVYIRWNLRIQYMLKIA